MASTVDELKSLLKLETAPYIKAMEQVKQQMNTVKSTISELSSLLKNLNIGQYLFDMGAYSMQTALEVSAAMNDIKLIMEESTQAFLKWGEHVRASFQSLISSASQISAVIGILTEFIQLFCNGGAQECNLFNAFYEQVVNVLLPAISVLNDCIDVVVNTMSGLTDTLTILVEGAQKGLDFLYNGCLLPISNFSLGENFPNFVTICQNLSAIDFSTLAGDLSNIEKILSTISKVSMPPALPQVFSDLNDETKKTTGILEKLEEPAKWLKDKFLDYIAKWTGASSAKEIQDILNGVEKVGKWLTDNQSVVEGAVTAFEGLFAVWKGVEILSFIGQAGSLTNAIIKIKDAVKLATVAKIKDKWETIQLNAMYAGEALAKGISTVATGALTAATWLLNAAITILTSPITLIIAAIAAVVAIGYLLVTNWDTVCAVAKQVWQTICDFIGGICQSIADFFVGLWNGLVATFQGVGQWFGQIFQEAWDGIVSIFTDLGTWFEARWNDIVNIFSGVGQWFGQMFQEAWDGIVSIFTDLGIWFAARWNDIVNIFSGVGQWFGQIFQDAWNGITNIFSVAGNWFNDVWNGIKGAFGSVSSFFSGIFQGAWNTITGIFEKIPKWFSDVFSKAWAGVRDIFSTGGKIFAGIVDGIAGVFKDVVNAIIDGINNVIAVPFNAINAALSRIRDIVIVGFAPFSWIQLLPVPQIPKLARGGIVDSATLAVVGEAGKEAVMPLENNTSWINELAVKLSDKMPNHMTTNKPMNIVLQLPNGREFARWTVSQINDLQSVSPYPIINM